SPVKSKRSTPMPWSVSARAMRAAAATSLPQVKQWANNASAAGSPSGSSNAPARSSPSWLGNAILRLIIEHSRVTRIVGPQCARYRTHIPKSGHAARRKKGTEVFSKGKFLRPLFSRHGASPQDPPYTPPPPGRYQFKAPRNLTTPPTIIKEIARAPRRDRLKKADVGAHRGRKTEHASVAT